MVATSVIPVIRKQRQEECQFKARLGYILRQCLQTQGLGGYSSLLQYLSKHIQDPGFNPQYYKNKQTPQPKQVFGTPVIPGLQRWRQKMKWKEGGEEGEH